MNDSNNTSLLTAEDSKRVADALIKKIEESDLDIAGAVSGSIEKCLLPRKSGWVADWFPEIMQDMCDRIARSVSDAAHRISKK